MVIAAAVLTGLASVLFYAITYHLAGGGFSRHFVDAIDPTHTVSVPNDHYYAAGSSDSLLYVSSEEHPFQLIAFTATGKRKDLLITPDTAVCRLPERVLVHVAPPWFYIQSKTGECSWNGSIEDGVGKSFRSRLPPFVHSVLLNSGSFALHTLRGNADGTDVTNVLGTITGPATFTEARETILIPQGEGLYSTDGFLRYCDSLKQVIYVYFFRNEYIVMDIGLHVISRAHTIDTIAHAVIEVTRSDDQQYTLKSPPVTVNKHARISGTKLFIHSGIRSDTNERRWFDHRAIIDVYYLV